MLFKEYKSSCLEEEIKSSCKTTVDTGKRDLKLWVMQLQTIKAWCVVFYGLDIQMAIKNTETVKSTMSYSEVCITRDNAMF